MFSTVSTAFPLKERDILRSDTTRYMILGFKGEGCFGKVAKCLDLIKGNTVAVKIHKRIQDHTFKKEVTMLEEVRAVNPDKKNIVNFIEHFSFNNLSCLAFEMLDKSLRDLIKERGECLSMNEIRPVTHQLLVALEALKDIGIMHTDLKPDNIMLVNHKDQPFKIKLIDFGLARPVKHAEVGMTMQAKAYRAPEVVLGHPLSESVDMWGVGCVIAYLYFGTNLFPGHCPYDWMRAFLRLLVPDGRLLLSGIYSRQYFTMDLNQKWRLWTPEEYEKLSGNKPKVRGHSLDVALNLEDAVKRFSKTNDDCKYKDRMAFLDLLKCCLHPNGNQRITPSEALKHTFITMVHLVDLLEPDTYMDSALDFMSVSILDELDDDTSCKSEHLLKEPLTDCCRRDTDSDNEDGLSEIHIERSSGIETDLDTKTISSTDTDSSSEEDELSETHTEGSSGIEADLDTNTTISSTDIDSSSEEDGLSEIHIERSSGIEADLDTNTTISSTDTDSSNEEDGLSEIHIEISSVTEADLSTKTISSTDTDSSSEENELSETHTEGSSGTEADLDTNTTSQPVISNNNVDPSCPRSTRKNESNKPHEDTSTPPKEELGTIVLDIVSTGGAAASVSSRDGAAAVIIYSDPENVQTGPVRARRRAIFRRIGKFFSRMRKLICC